MKKYSLVFALCLCVAFVASCNKKEAAAGGEVAKVDSTVMKNKEGVKKWYDAFNARNFDAMAALMDPNYVEHSLEPGQEPGLAGMKKMMTEMVAGFPDMKFSIVDMVAEGDKVTVLSRMEGTNSGPMMGMPPTNKKIDIMGLDMLKIVNGKATDHWGYYESRKMMEQLGLMPPMGGDMKNMEMKKK